MMLIGALQLLHPDRVIRFSRPALVRWISACSVGRSEYILL